MLPSATEEAERAIGMVAPDGIVQKPNEWQELILEPVTKAITSYGKKMASEAVAECLAALALMWNQYCAKTGHQFMSAGEAAANLLEKHNLLVDGDQPGEAKDGPRRG